LLANSDLALFTIVIKVLTVGSHSKSCGFWLGLGRLGLLGDNLFKFGSATLFFQYPVKLLVMLEVVLGHDILEELSQVVVIRLLFELHVAAILKVLREFFWRAPRYL